jgi:hypothetical protein
MPIAHSDGNYNCDEATLAGLEKNRRVIFRYTTPDGSAGRLTAQRRCRKSQRRGSQYRGICNRERNVAGRCRTRARRGSGSGSTDGLTIFRSDGRSARRRRKGHGLMATAATAKSKLRPRSPPNTASLPKNTRASKILGRSEHHGAGHLQRDVERALLVQIEQSAPERLPTRGKLVARPGRNAGVVDIGDGLVAAFKIESHNHPSYVEPFQGATTGVGGILRDIFTMGARPIAVLDSLRFGEITTSKNTSEEEAAKNRRILDGVIRGIANYGNCFGVPPLAAKSL